MDKEKFIENVQSFCSLRGVPPTVACEESGAGRYLLSKLKAQGSIPSVEKVQLLAAYLGVSTSVLLGEELPTDEKNTLSTKDKALLLAYHELNPEGQEILTNMARGMVNSGQYIKISEDRMDQKA